MVLFVWAVLRCIQVFNGDKIYAVVMIQGKLVVNLALVEVERLCRNPSRHGSVDDRLSLISVLRSTGGFHPVGTRAFLVDPIHPVEFRETIPTIPGSQTVSFIS